MKDRNTVEKGSISAECKREVQDPAAQLIGARAEFFSGIRQGSVVLSLNKNLAAGILRVVKNSL